MPFQISGAMYSGVPINPPVVPVLRLACSAPRTNPKSVSIARKARKLSRHPALPEVELITPIAMEKTIRFAIREGGKTVGAGRVSDILD